jgi:DNA (cytosine-5)-methyltransferase 1
MDFQEAPKFLRRITIKEAVHIQSFPENYIFKGGTSSIYKQIGNAVPCGLAEVVGLVVRDLLTKNPSYSMRLEQSELDAIPQGNV